MAVRAAVDVGGTFTDVIAFDEEDGALVIGKTLTTPDDYLTGIVNGLEQAEIPVERPSFLIHGSTIVINALIERKGANAALLTTAGFRDVYEIGRINRHDSFNFFFEKHRPLIPRERVFEIRERLLPDGSVLVPLDEEQVGSVVDRLRRLDVEAVAVAFLHAYRDPSHELRVGEILRNELPGVFVTLSHELTREYREFERTSTVAANAFVGPAVSRYLGRLEGKLRGAGSGPELAIMQSNGGVSDVATARAQCVQMMESGPAGGVVGTIALCQALGLRQAIAFDMGGTTAKAAVVREFTFPQAPDYYVGGYASGLPIRVPCLDIVEVGTGGGSIAWTDESGGLHVGPRSAGASPGPACYGLGGTEPTVTDASVILGCLSPDGDLAGKLSLDVDAARRSIGKLASTLGMSNEDAAAGVLAIAASSMRNAVRAITTERGLDPRDFTLVAYGGNGPLHVSLVARELSIRNVVIPRVPALFAALGMLMADVRRDFVVTHIRRLTETSGDVLEDEIRALEAEGSRLLADSDVDFRSLSSLRALDMRYVGQEHTVTVPVPADLGSSDGMIRLKSAFDSAHQERFSHSAADQPAEIVSIRVSVVGHLDKPQLSSLDRGGEAPPADARIGSRPIVLGVGEPAAECVVYRRSALLAGNRIVGPAAIEEETTTTLLRRGDELVVDEQGNLLLTIEASDV